jgi:phenylalanyl-tRNA synthetase alpha subunit
MLRTRWQTLQKESRTNTPPDKQIIASAWQTFRASLQKEMEREHRIAKTHIEDFGPTVLSMTEVEEQEQSIQSVTQAIDALIAIPAYHSARILWDTILTEKEKLQL